MDFDKNQRLRQRYFVEIKDVFKNELYFALQNHFTLIWCLTVYEASLWTFYHLVLTPVL